eukprot:TRINITY_DN5573_c0_g1_i1.p1 TRINITY_DN5573_c0_g1~~TRINITY_DN5573_c0_g1_i1.p1  ORF type:complete len:242 (+),score=39.66 TRINITY_DN5573_c0_g1_i1:103-828(+)
MPKKIGVRWQLSRGTPAVEDVIELDDEATVGDAKIAVWSLDTALDPERQTLVNRDTMKPLNPDAALISSFGAVENLVVLVKPAGPVRARSRTAILAMAAPQDSVCVDLMAAKKGGAPKEWPEHVRIPADSRASLATVGDLARSVSSLAGGGLAAGKELTLAHKGQLLAPDLALTDPALQGTIALVAAVVATAPAAPEPSKPRGLDSEPAAGDASSPTGTNLLLLVGVPCLIVAAFLFMRRK